MSLFNTLKSKFGGHKNSLTSFIVDDIEVQLIMDFENDTLDSILVETLSDMDVGMYGLSLFKVSPSGDVEYLADYDKVVKNEPEIKSFLKELESTIVDSVQSNQAVAVLTGKEKELIKAIREYISEKELPDLLEVIADDIDSGMSLEEAIKNNTSHVYFKALELEDGYEVAVEELKEIYEYYHGYAESLVLQREESPKHEIHGKVSKFKMNTEVKDGRECDIYHIECEHHISNGVEAANCIVDYLMVDDRVFKMMGDLGSCDQVYLNGIEVDMEQLSFVTAAASQYDVTEMVQELVDSYLKGAKFKVLKDIDQFNKKGDVIEVSNFGNDSVEDLSDYLRCHSSNPQVGEDSYQIYWFYERLLDGKIAVVDWENSDDLENLAIDSQMGKLIIDDFEAIENEIAELEDEDYEDDDEEATASATANIDRETVNKIKKDKEVIKAVKELVALENKAKKIRYDVNPIYNGLLEKYDFKDKSGNRITDHNRLYLSDDDMAAYYEESNKAVRKKHYAKEGQCPALVAEHEVVKKENEILDLLSKYYDFVKDMYDLKLRQEFLDAHKAFLVGASVKDKKKLTNRVHKVAKEHGIFYNVDELIGHMTAFKPENEHLLEEMSDDELLENIENAANIIDLNEENESTASTKGSGWGVYEPGKVLKNVDQIKPYDLLLNHSKKFNAKNVLRVTSVDAEKGKFYGQYVDPANVDSLRLPDDKEFCVWDFEFSEYFIPKASSTSSTNRGVITIRRFGKDRLYCVRDLKTNDIFCLKNNDLGSMKLGDEVSYEINENDEAVDLSPVKSAASSPELELKPVVGTAGTKKTKVHYKDLSDKAKKKARKEYLDGWLETHPDDPFSDDDAHRFLMDIEEDEYYEDGTYVTSASADKTLIHTFDDVEIDGEIYSVEVEQDFEFESNWGADADGNRGRDTWWFSDRRIVGIKNEAGDIDLKSPEGKRLVDSIEDDKYFVKMVESHSWDL